jgi:threonyl-tRNA synthetase
VRRIIRDFWEEEHLKNGYELVCTPHIARGELWSLATHHKGMGKCKEKCKNNVKITHSSKLLETVMETETIFYIFCNRHP